MTLLEIDGTNTKALLRAARASLALHNHEECEACLTKVLELDPNNILAPKEMNKLKQAKRSYNASSKVMAQRMFGKEKEKEKEKQCENGDNVNGNGQETQATQSTESATTTTTTTATTATTPILTPPPVQEQKADVTGSSNLLMLVLTALVVLIASVFIAKMDYPLNGNTAW